MNKWIPTLIPIISMVGVAFAPMAQHFIAAHPIASAVIACVGGVINHWLPAPDAKPAPAR